MTLSPPTEDVRRVHAESTLGRLAAAHDAATAALERHTTTTASLERTIGDLDAWLEAVTIATDVATFAEKRAKRELFATVLKRTRTERPRLEKQHEARRTEYERLRDQWHQLCIEHAALSDPMNPYTQRLTLGFVQTRPAEIESWLRTWAWEPAQPATTEDPS